MLVEELGADVNIADPRGNTPTHHAVLANATDSLLVLLDAGADLTRLNADKQRPLELAQARGVKDAIELLQERLAEQQSPTADDVNGPVHRTPSTSAAAGEPPAAAGIAELATAAATAVPAAAAAPAAAADTQQRAVELAPAAAEATPAPPAAPAAAAPAATPAAAEAVPTAAAPSAAAATPAAAAAAAHVPSEAERMKALNLTDAALKRMLPSNVPRAEALDVIVRFRAMDKDGRCVLFFFFFFVYFT